MRVKEREFLIAMANKMINLGEVANKTGISRQTLSYIKNGKKCKADLAGKIANALGVEVTEIFDVN